MKRTRLITARERKHWTQEDLAGHLEISAITVSRWETGAIKKLQAHSIERLCTVFGMTAFELGLSGEQEDTLLINEQLGATMTDHLFSSIRQNLTTLLMNIVISWPRRNHEYGELQRQISTTVEDYNVFLRLDESHAVTRRDALHSLMQLPIAFCGLGIAARALPVKKNVDETLAYLAAGVAGCWHCRTGKDFTLAYEVVSVYISVLRGIVALAPETQRKAAASLLVQSYLLKASLAIHVESDAQAIPYHKEALRFAQMAESPLLQAVAWRMLMITHSYAGRYDQALLAAEKAHGIMNGARDIPSTIQSAVFSGLALAQARNGQQNQALISLKHAHKTFDHNAPPPIWVQYNLAILADCDGLTQYALGRYQAATESLASIHTLGGSTIGRIEVFFDQAEVEVSRDDKPRDQERVIELWTQGMQGTRELKSEQRYHEARKVLQLMFVAWPGEPRVKELRDLAQHW